MWKTPPWVSHIPHPPTEYLLFLPWLIDKNRPHSELGCDFQRGSHPRPPGCPRSNERLPTLPRGIPLVVPAAAAAENGKIPLFCRPDRKRRATMPQDGRSQRDPGQKSPPKSAHPPGGRKGTRRKRKCVSKQKMKQPLDRATRRRV